MVDEWIDPIVQAYVEGKDFLFVIYKPFKVLPDGIRTGDNLYSARFYLEAPGLLHDTTTGQIFHFPDPNGRWFQHWERAGRDRTQSGFTVEFYTIPMPEPSVPGAKKEREYLFGPKLGTSFDGLGVGSGAAPEIKVDWVLRIYTR